MNLAQMNDPSTINSIVNLAQLVALIWGGTVLIRKIGVKEEQLRRTTELTEMNAKLLQQHDNDLAVLKDRAGIDN